jgi:hypothetical protein
MKQIIGLLITIVLVIFLWFNWKFRPWMPAGRAMQINNEHLEGYDFQVWQRKNTEIMEPFATGLFVRKQGEQWQVFLLDFQDTYHPSFLLQKQDSGIAILREGRKLGIFNETQHTFTRESDGASFTGNIIDAEPPGNWWLQSERETNIPTKRE